ncbi:glycoside hydrolase superfamily [Dichotomocladium elegans]|nr:glycoside hydrolase superfamily [Dichotomocladium elegans]
MFFRIKSSLTSLLLLAKLISEATAAFPSGYNVIQYWGQNSAGSSSSQKSLAAYCDDNTDVFILSFLVEFNVGKLPTLNFANACVDTYFEGTSLLKCDKIAADIKTCQSKGKKILLSLGGASGSYGFRNEADAKTFAKTLWNLFGAGSSNTRPFGSSVVDGFDLDIEGGGSTGYTTLVRELRSLFASDTSKDYYITAAPQCPYPDAILGTVIDSVEMDAVIVQFYNNYCAATTPNFNFETWDRWARSISPNKNVKVYLGIPGSPTAAGSGYVHFNNLVPIVNSVMSTYSSFGGIAMWDASQSYGNSEVSPNYATAVGRLVHNGPRPPSKTTTSKASSKTATTTSSSSATSVPVSAPCITHGAVCSMEGQYACTAEDYAVCTYGKWFIEQCPPGFACMTSTDSSSIYCAQPLLTADSCPTAEYAKVPPLFEVNVPKPYSSTNDNVTTQFSVTHLTKNSYEAIINARRTTNEPFGPLVSIQITMPANITVTHVSSGSISQIGRVVNLEIRNEHSKSMALVFAIKGGFKSGNVFIAPEADGVKFF